MVKICPKQIQDGGRPPSWKILISSQPLARFWNLACWCVSTLWTPLANKISRFQKSNMAAAAILKIWKIAISPKRNDRFWRNFVQWCVWALQTPSANKLSYCTQSLNFTGRCSSWHLTWVEQGLTSHQTHYRSYRGRVLWVKRPNQQCQSTEGREFLRTKLKSH